MSKLFPEWLRILVKVFETASAGDNKARLCSFFDIVFFISSSKYFSFIVSMNFPVPSLKTLFLKRAL